MYARRDDTLQIFRKTKSGIYQFTQVLDVNGTKETHNIAESLEPVVSIAAPEAMQVLGVLYNFHPRKRVRMNVCQNTLGELLDYAQREVEHN